MTGVLVRGEEIGQRQAQREDQVQMGKKASQEESPSEGIQPVDLSILDCGFQNVRKEINFWFLGHPVGALLLQP